MKTVYFQSRDVEWQCELDDEEFKQIIDEILGEGLDLQETLDEAVAIIRDTASFDDDELDEDDEYDQVTSAAFIWYYFNNLPDDKGRIDGDVFLVEEEDGSGIVVAAAKDMIDDAE